MILDAEQMPTEWEQDVAGMYVNRDRLDRPSTNIRTALIFILFFVFGTVALVWLVHCVLINSSAGIFALLPFPVQEFFVSHPILSIIILSITVIVIELFFCFKYAVIGAIRLYQHYAPEEIRRRCLFMPTCSEYAIMAVRKYGGIIGLCKSVYRLLYLCRGNIYRIHYP